MVEDGSGTLDNAGEFALEKYSRQSGSVWQNIDFVDIVAATKALAAANEAHALSIDPNAVDSMIRKLTAMQDELDKAMAQSFRIASNVPLGGGYAEEVAQVNRRIGGYVVADMVPKLTQAIDDLKMEIERSRASYRNVDAGNKGTIDNLQGRMQS